MQIREYCCFALWKKTNEKLEYGYLDPFTGEILIPAGLYKTINSELISIDNDYNLYGKLNNNTCIELDRDTLQPVNHLDKLNKNVNENILIEEIETKPEPTIAPTVEPTILPTPKPTSTPVIMNDIESLDISNLSSNDSIGKPYYMKYYDPANGGADTEKLPAPRPMFIPEYRGNGYVQEAIKNGKKYLVDANDYSMILLEDFSKIEENTNDFLVTYSNGDKMLISQSDFKPEKSYVLTR